MAEKEGWVATALKLYRIGRLALERSANDGRPQVQIIAEDLREVLLDLKEATVALDQVRAAGHVAEASLLIAELKELTQEAP